jgi:glycosyltransferase involved in cell wall biosynthesis
VYGKADAIVVLGTEFREKLISNGYAKDVFVETTLVPDEMLNGCRLKGPIETYKRKGNAFTVLFLARIERTKGIYEALEGYRRLKIQVPSSHLIVAGDGPELDRVQRHVKDSGLSDVRFLGFVEHEDKYRTFRNADAYLFPSFYAEGMPNSLLEAMASSLPSVTRPIGGVRDFFEDGSMGYLVEEGTPDEIGARLEHLYIDCELRRQMGRYSREFAGKHFAASTVIKRLEGIYRHVVSEGLFCAAHSWLDRPDSS